MKIRKEEKIKVNPSATQIAVVSGTLRNKELSANFKKGFLDIVAGSDKVLEMNIYDSARDPEYLLSYYGLIVIDDVVTWGVRKALLPQLRALQKECNSKCNFLVIPRKKKDRINFFRNPALFAKMLGIESEPSLVVLPRGDSLAEVAPICTKEVVPIEKEEVAIKEPKKQEEKPIAKKVLPALNILISLQDDGSFENRDEKNLAEALRKLVDNDSQITIARKPNIEMIHSADIFFSTTKTEKRDVYANSLHNGRGESGANKNCNNQRSQFGRNNKAAYSKEIRFQSLVHVGLATKINPRLRVIVVDRLLTKLIVRYRDVVSSFLEFPYSESSLEFMLKKAIREAGL